MTYRIKSRIWIEVDDKMFLGEGKVKLLKSITQTQSISKSAKLLKMSYKKAWSLVATLNDLAEKPVVIKKTGGSGGGGTIVTAYGEELIANFEKINKSCWNHLNKQVDKYFNQ